MTKRLWRGTLLEASVIVVLRIVLMLYLHHLGGWSAFGAGFALIMLETWADNRRRE